MDGTSGRECDVRQRRRRYAGNSASIVATVTAGRAGVMAEVEFTNSAASPDGRTERPYYVPVANEEAVFKAAYRQGLSLVLKGPTGCGKTRFVEAMAHDLDRPLITVSCHDDLTTADLVGRYLLRGGDTEWVDGPLTRAVRRGCHLLPRRGRRGPAGHHRRPASARRPPTAASHRPPGGHVGRGAGIRSGGVLQPGLPERAQGPQGLHASADGRHRVRLPRPGGRGGHRRPRVRCRPRRGGSWSASLRRSAGSRPAGFARWPRRGSSSRRAG